MKLLKKIDSQHKYMYIKNSGLEQWLARQAHVLKVEGSIPSSATKGEMNE